MMQQQFAGMGKERRDNNKFSSVPSISYGERDNAKVKKAPFYKCISGQFTVIKKQKGECTDEKKDKSECSKPTVPIPKNEINKAEKQETCNCIIEVLLKTPFNSLSFAEQLKIVECGGPKPSMYSVLVTDKLDGEKSFVKASLVYSNTWWMCACKKMKKIYCWPCLLFSCGTQGSHIWSATAFNDFNKNSLSKVERHHKLNCSHILSSKELILFGKKCNNFDQMLSNDYKVAVDRYNEIVTHNRNILSYLTTAVCFLGSQGLNFNEFKSCRSDDGHLHNLNIRTGNYYNLVNIIADYNSDLKTHIRNTNMFSVFSPSIYNDLIFCISEVMVQEIKKEISNALFVSLILNEITHINATNRVSAVFRYADKNGDIKERFLNFIDLKSDRSSGWLSECIIKIISEFDCSTKLITYNLDGAVIEIDKLTDLETKVQKHFKQALFVNSYSNKLSDILSQSVCFIKEVKIFFASLSSFGNFFAKSNKRTEALDPELFLSISPNQWNSQSGLITIIQENKLKFETLLLSIIFEPIGWDLSTISSAYNLFLTLKDFDFIFYLEVFYLTLPVADTLFHVIQKHVLYDINYCFKKIEDFNLYLVRLNENFEGLWQSVCRSFVVTHDNDKEASDKTIPKESKAASYQYFHKITGILISNIITRYSNLSKLQFFNLLDSKKFTQFKMEFPDAAFSSLKESYGSHFDFNCLKSELSVIYWDQQMVKDDLLNFYNYLRKLKLVTIFPETCKLFQLILTMPVVNLEGDKTFSAVTRINNYADNDQRTRQHNVLSSDAILYIESSFLEKIKLKKEFLDNVIEIFATKNHKIELTYKK